MRQKWDFRWNRKKLPHLKLLLGYNFAGAYKWDFIDMYRMGEFYYIPKVNQLLPPPPREAIQQISNADGLVIIACPERSLYEFLKLHIENVKDEKGKLVPQWINFPAIVTGEVSDVIKRDAEFKLLYMQSLRRVQAEKDMLLSFLQKNFVLIAGLIAVIALAIMIVVSVNGWNSITTTGAKSLAEVVKAGCNAPQVAANITPIQKIF
jgi:hypothetical protein